MLYQILVQIKVSSTEKVQIKKSVNQVNFVIELPGLQGKGSCYGEKNHVNSQS